MMSAGQVREGSSLSITVTVNVAAPSPVPAVTVVVPTGKKLPDGGSTSSGVGQSPGSTVKFTTAPHSPGSLLTTMSAGTTGEHATASTNVPIVGPPELPGQVLEKPPPAKVKGPPTGTPPT